MALIDDIVKKINKDGVNPSPIVEPKAKTAVTPAQTPQEQVTPMSTSQPANRWGYDDETIAHLSQSGYPTEVLERITSFDPSKSDGFIEQLYRSTTPAPVAPDEKKIRNARLASSIADSLGFVSQMISVGRGAQLPVRTYDQSASARTDAEARRLQDLYRNESANYGQGLYDARLRDLLDGLRRNQGEREAVNNIVAAKRKADWDQTQFEAKQAALKAEREQDQENRNRDFDERRRKTDADIKRGEALTAQGWARLKDGTSSGGGSGGSRNAGSIVLRANRNDPDAVRDGMGNYYREYPMSKEQAEAYYRDAILDPGFRQRHPDFFPAQSQFEETKEISHTTQEIATIAKMYAQDQYDSQPWGRDIPSPSSQITWRSTTPVVDEDDQYLIQ